MSLKVKLAKKINGVLQILNPQTEADAVVYDESLTVKEVLDALVDAVDNIENSLFLDTIYITTSDGEIVTDDDGTGAVAVASLTAVETTSSSSDSTDNTSTISDDSEDTNSADGTSTDNAEDDSEAAE